MKILFDHSIFELQKFGGVSKYFIELYKEFRECNDVDFLVKYSDNENIKELNLDGIEPMLTEKDQFLHGKNFKGKTRLFNLLKRRINFIDYSNQNLTNTISKLNSQDFDVFHPTYFSNYFIPHLNGKPFVVTVYDLISSRYPEFYSTSLNEDKIRKEICNKASRIIAISDKTKKDLIEYDGISDDKIDVIHLASSFTSTSHRSSFLDIKKYRRYILFTGQRGKYKNFYFFYKSIKPLLRKDSQLYLLCTGPGLTREEVELFKMDRLEHQVVHFFAKNDEELSTLYRNASCFVFPSYYEGFGLPIIDAFYCDCPVILSRTSCFPEIAGDAALFFDPKSSLEIKKAVESVVYSNDIRQRLINLGRERRKKYSWKKTADLTLDTYRRV